MPKTPKQPRVPSYRRHKPSGQAIVTLDGREPAGAFTGETPKPQEGPEILNEGGYVPLVAIGGITSENVATLHAEPAGAQHIRVAICQDVIGADDPAAAAANLKKALSAEAAKA